MKDPGPDDLGTRRTVAVRFDEATWIITAWIRWIDRDPNRECIAAIEQRARKFLESMPSENRDPECSICRRRHKSDDRHPCE